VFVVTDVYTEIWLKPFPLRLQKWNRNI